MTSIAVVTRANASIARKLRVTVFVFVAEVVVVIVFFGDSRQLKRLHSDNFEVGATFCARNDFPFIEFIFFDVEIVLAFWT